MKYENGIETREAILKVSRKLFFDKGYCETTFDDICREANVNRGSIYYHFKSKKAIINVIVGEEMYARLRRVVDSSVGNCSELEKWIIYVYIYWYRFSKDEKFRKLFIAWAENLDTELYLKSPHRVENRDDFMGSQILDYVIYKNLGIVLSVYFASHLHEFTYDQVAEYDILTEVKLRGGDLITMKNEIEKTKKILDLMDLDKLSAMF